jgi:outer membrane protein OmpA-like peptidoglycan-associated protein
MKLIRLALLSFSIIYLSISAIAQTSEIGGRTVDVKKPTPAQMKRLGDELAASGSYYNAIEYYRGFLEKYPTDDKVMISLAQTYQKARDYQNAEEWYTKAFNTNKKENGEMQYWAAIMMKYNGKYDVAKTELESLIKKFPAGPNASVLKKQAKIEAEGCDLALKLIDNQPENIQVEHLGSNINNPYSDFAPAALGEKELVFSSIKSDTVVVIGGPERADYVSRIYKSTKNETTGKWSKAKEFGDGNINSDVEHSGNGSFSPDGKMFFYTRCKEKSDQDLHIICEIFVSKKLKEGWDRPEKLNTAVNKPGSSNTQPAVGRGPKNELVLYFVSDREEGTIGGTDIYYCTVAKDGTCSDPVNLGKQVNTIMDENSPYFDDRDGYLYFASNGRISIGGFDIYKSKGNMKKFENAENLGFPINSSCDDRYFNMRRNHKSAFVVSNRPGGFELKSATCCDDIFEISYRIIPKFAVKGKIYDERDRKKKKKTPLTPSLITVTRKIEKKYWKADTTYKRQPEYFFTLEPDKSYKLKAVREGYYVGYDTVSTKGLVDSDTMEVDIYLRKIDLDAIKIKGIHYDFDYHTLRPDSKPALDSLIDILRENYLLIVQINSHTDNKGDDEYNRKLSQRRAQSVVDFLKLNGIDSIRLKAKGFGETLPDTINQNADGSDCPECRQKNRRTEFQVIGVLPNTDIIYEDNDPETIDSTSSTRQKLDNEKSGRGREQLKVDEEEAKKSKEDFEKKKEFDKLAPPKELPTDVIKDDQTEAPKKTEAPGTGLGDKDKGAKAAAPPPAAGTGNKDKPVAKPADKPAAKPADKPKDKKTDEDDL